MIDRSDHLHLHNQLHLENLAAEIVAIGKSLGRRLDQKLYSSIFIINGSFPIALPPPYASSTPLETCAAAKVEVSEGGRAITPPYASSTPLGTSAAAAPKVEVSEGGTDTTSFSGQL
nr:hypothetical protein Iba_chr07dCG10730 [Ipomoea batatas]